MIKDYNDSTEDLNRTIELITSVIGSGIELKISCLNPTEFAKNNSLNAVAEDDLRKLLQATKKLNLKKVYVFGPMSEEKLGCGQLA